MAQLQLYFCKHSTKTSEPTEQGMWSDFYPGCKNKAAGLFWPENTSTFHIAVLFWWQKTTLTNLLAAASHFAEFPSNPLTFWYQPNASTKPQHPGTVLKCFRSADISEAASASESLCDKTLTVSSITAGTLCWLTWSHIWKKASTNSLCSHHLQGRSREKHFNKECQSCCWLRAALKIFSMLRCVVSN